MLVLSVTCQHEQEEQQQTSILQFRKVKLIHFRSDSFAKCVLIRKNKKDGDEDDEQEVDKVERIIRRSSTFTYGTSAEEQFQVGGKMM